MIDLILAGIIGFVVGERVSTFFYQQKIEDFAEALVKIVANNVVPFK